MHELKKGAKSPEKTGVLAKVDSRPRDSRVGHLLATIRWLQHLNVSELLADENVDSQR